MSECKSCAVGKRMGHGEGFFCPFLKESLPAGSIIFEQGSEAKFSWYLKEGVVGLVHENGTLQIVRGPTDVLGPALIKSGRRTARAMAITEVRVCRGANEALTIGEGQ